MNTKNECCIYLGEGLASYAFGNNHPFGPKRYEVFREAYTQQGLDKHTDILQPVIADQGTLELFHTHEYVEKVKQRSKLGTGYLDHGNTPAFIGMFEAASTVAGSVCDAVDRLLSGEYKRAFIPIAGLHHARRHTAAGFCVFNDCGIAIEYLRYRHNIKRIAYVDIDAHHADGVYYSFEDDPDLVIADVHEDGHYLYPGTGAITETGIGAAQGTKLNVPMPPYADDKLFRKAWPAIENFIRAAKPEFILLQCGADSIAGDPITQLDFTETSHAYAAQRLCKLADEFCGGKIIVMGGGGYNLQNIARTWTAVVKVISGQQSVCRTSRNDSLPYLPTDYCKLKT